MTEPAKAAAPPKADQLVTVRAPDGTLGTIPASQLGNLPDGATIPTPDEIKAEKLQAEYGTVGGQAASAGLGFARGATFGLSDVVASGVGGDKVRQALANYQEANPTASTLGEVGGVIAPAVLSGGAGATGTVAKVLSAPVRAVGALGGAAERGVASVVGHGAESLAGKLAQKAIPMMASGATEGAIYGVGQQISESTLGDHELTAERLLAGAKGGALFGGLAGGTLGLGGELLATGGRKVAEKLSGEGGLSSMLRRESEGQAFKATGAQLRDFQKLGRTAEEIEAKSQSIGRTLLDEDIVTAGASKEDIATRLQAKTKQVGEELGAMRSELDKAAARPNVSNIIDDVRSKVLEPMVALPGTDHEANVVRSYLEDFVKKAGDSPSFDTIYKFRKRLDDQINFDKLKVDPATAARKQIRGILEGEFERAGEEAAQELGTSFLEKYKTTKDLYSKLATAEQISTKSVARQSANRTISLTDTIAGGHGGVAGALIGHAVGGIGGGIVGEVLGGAISAAANHYVREYGNQVMSDALNRATRVQAIQRAAHKTEDELERGVVRFITVAPRAAKTAATATGAKQWSRENFEQVTQHVATLKNNPELQQSRLATETNELGTVAPNTAMSIGVTHMRAVVYLSANTPPSLAPPSMLTPFVPRAKQKSLSLDEMKFMRKAQAVQDPKGTILKGLDTRTLSLDSVNAIKEVYPKLFADLQRIVGDKVAERKDPESPLDTDVLYRLGLITGVKTHFTQEPSFISAVQATKTPPPKPDDQQQPAQPAQVDPHAVKLAQQLQTPSEEILT